MIIHKRTLLNILVLLYVFAVLSLPDGIKNMTALYKMTTSGLPLENTYNYYFTILEIPIIVLGLAMYRSSRAIRFGIVYAAVAAVNVVFYLVGGENIFSLGSYEMFLMLLTGMASASIVLHLSRDDRSTEMVLDCFSVLQLVLLGVNAAVNGSADGRYSAVGMGSGITASLAAFYLVWTFFARKGRTALFPAACAFVTLVLSGSRANQLALAAVVILCSVRLIRRFRDQGRSKLVAAVLYIGVPVILVTGGIMIMDGEFGAFSRIAGLFKGDFFENLISDSSFQGRVRSFLGSVEILKENPLGLPFSIYAIERESARAFSMEYPHSTLLSYILLWSPLVALACFGYLVVLFIRLVRNKDDGAVFVGYYLVMCIIYGAPILHAKTYAFLLIVFSYIKNNTARKAPLKELGI